MSEGRGLLEELRRRHVWRVAVAYAIAAWLLVQIATQVFPFFNIPNWVVRVVVLLLVLGFPVVIALAWAYEVTPEGIRRTEPADSPEARAAHEHRSIGQKLNAIIITVLVLAVAVTGWRLYAVRRMATPPQSATAANAARAPKAPVATQSVHAKSIAVLPFENLSGDKDNAYFVAGMQDLILTKLADVGDLKVIARTSTAKYASRPDDLKTIGEQLGVAVILEGSVQKAGNEVLINVQLIDCRTDSHIWAHAYTRTLDNVFGVEGEVAGQIATSLDARLSSAQTASLAAVPTRNAAAYDLFLRAEYLANQGDINYDLASWKAAIPLYRRALQQDPGFALAWARLSYVQSILAWFGGGGDNAMQLNQQARTDAQRALQLQPDLAAAQLALGYTEYWSREDYDAALKAFAAALALKPNDADALTAQGLVERRQGRFDAAIASFQQALTLDPRNSELTFELGGTYMMVSRYAETENAFQRALALDPYNRIAKSRLSLAILLSTGDVPQAEEAAQGDDPESKLQRTRLLILQRKYQAALVLLDSIPDKPDIAVGFVKARVQAWLYWLLGDKTRARALYAQDLPRARAQLGVRQGISLAPAWQDVADDELSLGHTAQGLAAVAKAQAIIDASVDHTNGPRFTARSASLYAQARRADLAVPLLAKALAMPGIGAFYSPVMLWLDPDWDPIGRDPRFQALQAQYARYKPAVIYPIPPSGAFRQTAVASAPAQSAAK